MPASVSNTHDVKTLGSMLLKLFTSYSAAYTDVPILEDMALSFFTHLITHTKDLDLSNVLFSWVDSLNDRVFARYGLLPPNREYRKNRNRTLELASVIQQFLNQVEMVANVQPESDESRALYRLQARVKKYLSILANPVPEPNGSAAPSNEWDSEDDFT
jgi:hypothetical protein